MIEKKTKLSLLWVALIGLCTGLSGETSSLDGSPETYFEITGNSRMLIESDFVVEDETIGEYICSKLQDPEANALNFHYVGDSSSDYAFSIDGDAKRLATAFSSDDTGSVLIGKDIDDYSRSTRAIKGAIARNRLAGSLSLSIVFKNATFSDFPLEYLFERRGEIVCKGLDYQLFGAELASGPCFLLKSEDNEHGSILVKIIQKAKDPGETLIEQYRTTITAKMPDIEESKLAGMIESFQESDAFLMSVENIKASSEKLGNQKVILIEKLESVNSLSHEAAKAKMSSMIEG